MGVLRGMFYAGLFAIAIRSIVTTSFAPVSWAIVSLCAWCAVGTMKGWAELDVWERRLFLWALFSVVSFTHFLLSDPEFTSWSSVYFYCGDDMRYCTSNFRWNMRGWRKATALWNFCLATALAFQRLGVEAGLGGLLPGEEVVTRESFMSIGWRLIPFWLNRWESNFGAECSSILFELPHFALELLVVLPMVQILCGRLRIVGQPHVRAGGDGDAGGGRDRGLQPHGGPDEAPTLVPNVLMCAWVRDSSQRKLIPRLRANTRAMAMLVLVSCVAAMNALVVPLGLERQAAYAPRSLQILDFAHELDMLLDVGNKADLTKWYVEHISQKYKEENTQEGKEGVEGSGSEEEGQFYGTSTSEGMYAHLTPISSATQCVERGNCSSSIQAGLVAALKEHGVFTWRALPGSLGLFDIEINAEALLVPAHWVMPLLEVLGNDDMYSNKSRTDAALSVEKLAVLLLPPHSNDYTAVPPPSPLSLSSSIDAMRRSQGVYLKSVASGTRLGDSGGAPFPVLPRLYRNLHKHTEEQRRMRDPKHRAMVPLVEGALTIMRLSCERWFALVAVYVGYLVFLDPPPAARVVIRGVARLSRVFQRCILMSFPAVCWAYGAGVVFSTFASLIFWTGPVMRALERLRSVATEVRPQEWHPATPEELERMGGACAICWGSLDAGATAPGHTESTVPMGLPCSHAYHQQCLIDWLQSCYGQSRTPICPMCQAEVPLHVRYRVSLSSGAHADAAAAEAQAPVGEGGAVEGGAEIHRRERGIPGLDALVDDLRDEFQHRFEQPVGPLHFGEERPHAGEGDVVGDNRAVPADGIVLPAPPLAQRREGGILENEAAQEALGGGQNDGEGVDAAGPRRRGVLHRIFNRREIA